VNRSLPRLGRNADFVERMRHGWGPLQFDPPLGPDHAASVARHRAALSAEFPGTALVVFAGGSMLRNDDNLFPFRPDSDFLWLTGCNIEGAVLVMLPQPGGHESVLFAPPPITPQQDGFVDSRNHSPLYVGDTAPLDAWQDALGMTVRPLADAQEWLRRLPSADQVLVAGRVTPIPTGLPGIAPELVSRLSELRLIKDDWEIAELRRSVDASVAGFEAVRAELTAAMEFGGERWLQGTFDRHARTLGNGTGYISIVAAGAHAPVLHWTRCDGPIEEDQLILLDGGVEISTFYTADVTRTFPAGGTFSSAQRQVHDLVEKAHLAGLDAVGPGRAWTDFNFASLEVLARGLHDWGLLDVSVDEAVSEAGQHHRRYIICDIGHHLGLDVHDCSGSRHEAYWGGTLETGMVLTVEPGLYFHQNDLTLPPELRGIGVRIEDDVLVTPDGNEVISAALPIDASGLERWVADTTTHPRKDAS
jgi:Xaa-Pro aminopeptidase